MSGHEKYHMHINYNRKAKQLTLEQNACDKVCVHK